MSVHHWIEQVHWLVQVDHSSSDLQHQPCTSTWMWASVVYVIVRCINQKHVKCVGVIYLSYVSSLSTDTPTIRLDSLMQCLGCLPPRSLSHRLSRCEHGVSMQVAHAAAKKNEPAFLCSRCEDGLPLRHMIPVQQVAFSLHLMTPWLDPAQPTDIFPLMWLLEKDGLYV